MQLLSAQWVPKFLFRQVLERTASESMERFTTERVLLVKILKTQDLPIFILWILLKRQISDCTMRQMQAVKNGSSMRQVFEEEQLNAVAENREQLAVGMIIHNDKKQHDQGRYNCPTSNEISVVFKSIDGAPPSDRDIRGHLLISTRGKRFIQIDPNKSMCDPMTYPLLFPNGDSGWNPNILYRTNDERRAAEGDENEEEYPDEISNERGPVCETVPEEAEDRESDLEETMVDVEDESTSRRRANEIIIIGCEFIIDY